MINNSSFHKSIKNFRDYNPYITKRCIMKNEYMQKLYDNEYILLLGDSRMLHLISTIYEICREKKFIIISLLFWIDSIKYKNYICIKENKNLVKIYFNIF